METCTYYKTSHKATVDCDTEEGMEAREASSLPMADKWQRRELAFHRSECRPTSVSLEHTAAQCRCQNKGFPTKPKTQGRASLPGGRREPINWQKPNLTCPKNSSIVPQPNCLEEQVSQDLPRFSWGLICTALQTGACGPTPNPTSLASVKLSP